MSFITEKEDLRTIKTERALNGAMHALLRTQNFRQLTVRIICEKALISRATFYSHFADKYDLLAHWLATLASEGIKKDDPYPLFAHSVNLFVRQHKRVIKNILTDADNETMEIVFDYILSVLNLDIEKYENNQISQKYLIFSTFCAGGMVQYLLWHIKHKFPGDIMNRYLYDLIVKFREWEM